MAQNPSKASMFRGAALLFILLPFTNSTAPKHHRMLAGELGPADSPECDLCADNWLFILAAGRGAASTTAFSMFNSVPHFEITGEHYGVLHAEVRIFDLLKEALDVEEDSPAWGGNGINKQAMLCNVQNLMKALVFGGEFNALAHNTTVLGFKEVRYKSWKMLRFMAQVFPCARFVFAVPHQSAGADMSKPSQLFHEVAAQFPSTTSLLPRDTLSLDKYNSILGSLGVRGCTFRKLLYLNVGGSSTYNPEQHSGVLEGSCDLSGVDFRLSPAELAHNEQLWTELSKELGQPLFTVL